MLSPSNLVPTLRSACGAKYITRRFLCYHKKKTYLSGLRSRCGRGECHNTLNTLLAPSRAKENSHPFSNYHANRIGLHKPFVKYGGATEGTTSNPNSSSIVTAVPLGGNFNGSNDIWKSTARRVVSGGLDTMEGRHRCELVCTRYALVFV